MTKRFDGDLAGLEVHAEDWFAKGLEGRGYNNGDEFGNDGTRKSGEIVTFNSWKHYDESSPLFESGLLGPVTVTGAELVDIKV
ncbi:hypothetical protein FALCPG4_005565 [Fusarium falciforme]